MLVTSPRCEPPEPAAGQFGFTMIELVVVIVIMAVLATTAIPRLMSSDSQDRATAELLRSNLRYAQRVAASRNRDVCVTVTAATVTFRIAPTIGPVTGAGIPCPGVAVITPYNESTATDTLDIALPAGSATSFTPARNFRFTPMGTLRNNAGTALAAQTINVVHGGAALATMDIEPENGYVLSSSF